MRLTQRNRVSPPRPRLVISNVTTDKAVAILAENPSGLLAIRDELAEMVASFDRYGKGGGDKELWLQAYGGRPHIVDRVGRDEPIKVARTAISIVGGIVPDRLDALLLGGDNDGFGARFLYFVTDESKPVDLKEPGADTAVVERLFDRLHGLSWGGTEVTPVPKDVPLDHEAEQALQEWLDAHHTRKSTHYGLYGSALGKMDGQVGRLTLVIEFVRWAESDAQVEPETISAGSVRAAATLMDQYFEPMLRRALGEGALPKAERDAMKIARALLDRRPATVNARRMRQSWGLHGIGKAEDFDKALGVLVEIGWLFPAEETKGPGRKPKNFSVAPEISGIPLPATPRDEKGSR